MTQVDPKKLLHKEDALLELLATHAVVQVHVNTCFPGVVVPEQLLGRPQIAFELGYNLPVPIRDLKVRADGWYATMSFNRQQFACYFPWGSVWMIVGKETGLGSHWKSDIPDEIIRKAEEVKAASERQNKTPPTAKKLPKGWKILDGGKIDGSGPHKPKAS